jgi:hypothetical protein
MHNDVRNIVEDKDFTNKWLVNTLFNIPKSEYDNIAATLRAVGNKNIDGVELRQLSYFINGERLSLINLSTGEFVWLLGEIARICNCRVIIIDLVSQLDLDNLEAFISKYKDTDIWVVTDDNKRDMYSNIYGCGVYLCAW